MRFEWDVEKAALNVAKHRVSFEEAVEVFFDPNALDDYDPMHSQEEMRFFIIGLSSRRLLRVVYAERDADLLRIISARKANKMERKVYEGRTN